MTNAIINNTESIVDFCKTWIENVTGRKAVEQIDKASKWYHVDEQGRGRSWLWSLGVDNVAELRFQLWLTTRGSEKTHKSFEQFDLYVGTSYQGENGIDVSLLTPYQRHTKHDNVESTFRHVPMYIVAEFFKANDLCDNVTATTKKAEQKTA